MKSPSSSKKLFELQKQLGIRVRARRAAMLADDISYLSNKDDDEEEEDKETNEDSDDTINESTNTSSEVLSNVDKDNVKLDINESLIKVFVH